jgi:hypothetical protein
MMLYCTHDVEEDLVGHLGCVSVLSDRRDNGAIARWSE